MKRTIRAMMAGGIGLLMMAGSASAATVNNNTASTAQLIEELGEADLADQMNSVSWNDNPSLNQYYDRKAAQVEKVIMKIQKGEPVAPHEVSRALDNSGASAY